MADQRVAGPHVTVHLCEPRSPHGIPGRELETLAAEHARQLRRLQERIADACGRPVDEIAADMRAGKLLTPQEAQAYGLIDSAGTRVLSGPDLHVVEIVGLLASPGHRYDGRPGASVPEQAADRREQLEIRAGFGVVGDRYAGRPRTATPRSP